MDDIFLLMGNEKAQNDSRGLLSKFLSSNSPGNQSIDSHPRLHSSPDSTLLKQLAYIILTNEWYTKVLINCIIFFFDI